ncbi:MAG: DUF4271 domain-containing protein [Spirosomataceae bacterium]
MRDLSQEWLIYDQNEKNYVPYIPERHNNQLAINTLIDLESNRHYDLLIYVEKENYLFLNGSLQENLQAGVWRVLPLDSLFQIYRRPELMLTLYGTSGQTGKIVLIGHKKAAIEKQIVIEEESFLNLKPREDIEMSNFFILGMLLLIASAAFLYRGYPRTFDRFYSVIDLFQINIRDESFLINKPFSRTNLLFVGLLSLEFGYIYLFIQDKQYNLFSSKELLLTGQSLSDAWLNYFKIAFFSFFLLISKYFSLYILSVLYRLQGAANVHYFKIIQSSLLFYSGMIVLTSFASFYIFDWSSLIHTMLIIPGIIFYVARVVLIFFTISNTTTVKSLYLISYLCIVELIPLIIGVRYAL